MPAPLDPSPGSPFGAHALPFGVVRPRAGGAPRVAARVGDAAVDLAALAAAGLLDDPAGAFAAATLNPFLARGRATWRATRVRLRELVEAGAVPDAAVLALAGTDVLLPVAVGDFADFYSSRHHAENVGRMFRAGEDPLPPNWRHAPLGYHGRAGTVVVSGTPVVRPWGQVLGPGASRPSFRPSARLDVELELGFVIGVPSALGEPVPVDRALEHVFGVVLLNDWSARDVQAWEYRPLGPFLGKSFATSIAGWVLPLEALAAHRVPAGPQEPEPLPYLRCDPWAYDLDLELELRGEVVARTSARHLYWNVAQQVAHLTAGGASLRVGDLLGSGTISGPGRGERGSLLELTWDGQEPLELADGSRRAFLEDGDEVVLRGAAGPASAHPVGLAEVRGRILPARDPGMGY